MPRLATALQRALREGVNMWKTPFLGLRATFFPLAELHSCTIHCGNP